MHYEAHCGDLIKVVWHDGQGACLFTKRLERGRFKWPSYYVHQLAVLAGFRLIVLANRIDCADAFLLELHDELAEGCGRQCKSIDAKLQGSCFPFALFSTAYTHLESGSTKALGRAPPGFRHTLLPAPPEECAPLTISESTAFVLIPTKCF
ncbi:hypothetical protein ATY75_30670 [Rhizobium sp. N122]|nr:hypothetical protein ATY75_30670 [Rhizobium sp. N122]PON08447.1 hypothetical protein ATY29_05430 [Rhizobium hidalgonense]